jgi:hypothetical protein
MILKGIFMMREIMKRTYLVLLFYPAPPAIPGLYLAQLCGDNHFQAKKKFFKITSTCKHCGHMRTST